MDAPTDTRRNQARPRKRCYEGFPRCPRKGAAWPSQEAVKGHGRPPTSDRPLLRTASCCSSDEGIVTGAYRLVAPSVRNSASSAAQRRSVGGSWPGCLTRSPPCSHGLPLHAAAADRHRPRSRWSGGLRGLARRPHGLLAQWTALTLHAQGLALGAARQAHAFADAYGHRLRPDRAIGLARASAQVPLRGWDIQASRPQRRAGVTRAVKASIPVGHSAAQAGPDGRLRPASHTSSSTGRPSSAVPQKNVT